MRDHLPWLLLRCESCFSSLWNFLEIILGGLDLNLIPCSQLLRGELDENQHCIEFFTQKRNHFFDYIINDSKFAQLNALWAPVPGLTVIPPASSRSLLAFSTPLIFSLCTSTHIISHNFKMSL